TSGSNMLQLHRLLFLLYDKNEIHRALGVWTLHKVLGQKGASITVPCHYDPKYKDNTKYWCRGYQWATCLVMARSTSTQSGGKVSIRDESSQQLFIVTMRNLTERDTNKYWCAVKIGSSVGLSVLDNMVAGVAGDSVTVRCFYRDRYALSPRKWCRSSDWGSCVTAGEARANRVLISDNGTGVFAVTLKALTEKDQGWYWCASGDAQVPIHITVMTPATAGETGTLTVKRWHQQSQLYHHHQHGKDHQICQLPCQQASQLFHQGAKYRQGPTFHQCENQKQFQLFHQQRSHQ
uniref:Immunoglobulin domain-containing protein n=1 Tax=Scleropages formosus TaxID=113540 RepID=A0A8C9RQ39_SCLFO